MNCAFSPVTTSRKRVGRQNAEHELPSGGGNSDIPRKEAVSSTTTVETPTTTTTTTTETVTIHSTGGSVGDTITEESTTIITNIPETTTPQLQTTTMKIQTTTQPRTSTKLQTTTEPQTSTKLQTTTEPQTSTVVFTTDASPAIVDGNEDGPTKKTDSQNMTVIEVTTEGIVIPVETVETFECKT